MRPIRPEILQRAREMRRQPTPAEATLWRSLRNRQVEGLKFRRQHPIGPFIVDFYWAEGRLVVELDGGIHLERKDYDAARTAWLNEQGYRVIRFTNEEVKSDLQAVVESILENCKAHG